MKTTTIFSACLLLITGNAFAGTNSTGIGATTPSGSGIITSVSSNNSVAVGQGSGSGDNGVAVGAGTTAGTGSVAVGNGTNADNNAVSIGSGSNVEGSNVGVGNNQTVTGVGNAVALGNNTVATRSNEVGVGGRTIGNVGAAVANDQATNLGQTTNLVNAGVAQAVTQSNAYTDKAVAGVVGQANAYTDSKFNQASQIAYSAAAVGLASSALTFNPNLPRQIAIGASTVHGTSALALGIAWKHGNNGMFNVRGALGQNGTSGVAIGYSMGF